MANNILLPADSLPLISLADTIQCKEGFIHPDRIMDVNILLYVYEGSFHIHEENADGNSHDEYTLTEGSLLFLKSGCHHYGDSKCPDGTKWFFVHFYLPEPSDDAVLLEPWEHFLYSENSLGINNNRYYVLPKLINLKENQSIRHKFDTLTHMFTSAKLDNRLQMNAFFCQILMEIYRDGLHLRVKTSTEEKVDNMLIFLDKHKNENFSSSAIEENMGLSFKHLNLLFKSITGTTLQKHHNHLRMEAAAKLLRETTLEISEISNSLGYEEPFYFSNSFKKHFGTSPRDYRKKQFFI